MNKALLHTNIQDFIRNSSISLEKFLFGKNPFEGVSKTEIIQQIESRNKAKDKLPTWFKTNNIYYPPKLNLEQTSSEITAKYKASIISGNSIADITGGFGVDCFYFSEKFKEVSHFEINKDLQEIASYNFNVFGKNIVTFNTDGLDVINDKHFDVIYIDPSRRNESKGKVFLLKDCLPNVPENFEALLKSSETILVKTSPMLDISVGLTELSNVSQIHIVAVNNDVKELLWLIEKSFTGDPVVKTINFKKNKKEIFNFTLGESASSAFAMPKKYLYEPNAAILKSGAFNHLTTAFSVSKLHLHSHLYTSEELLGFPGRRFVIKEIVPYSKKNMKESITFTKANITIRNFKESVATIRKKWKIQEGGNIYLFFTTISNEVKVMLICEKVE